MKATAKLGRTVTQSVDGILNDLKRMSRLFNALFPQLFVE